MLSAKSILNNNCPISFSLRERGTCLGVYFSLTCQEPYDLSNLSKEGKLNDTLGFLAFSERIAKKKQNIIREFFSSFSYIIQTKEEILHNGFKPFSILQYKQKNLHSYSVSFRLLFTNAKENETSKVYVFEVVTYTRNLMRVKVKDLQKTPCEIPPFKNHERDGKLTDRVKIRSNQICRMNVCQTFPQIRNRFICCKKKKDRFKYYMMCPTFSILFFLHYETSARNSKKGLEVKHIYNKLFGAELENQNALTFYFPLINIKKNKNIK